MLRWLGLACSTAALVACGHPSGPQGVGGAAAPTAAPRHQVASTAAGAQPVAPAPRRVQQAQTVPATSTRFTATAPAPAPHLSGEQAARQRELEHQLAADPNPTRRREAIDQFTHDRAETQPLLDSVFSEPDPLVRRWAAMALVREAKAEHAQALKQAIPAERDPKVKRILEQALRAAELRGS